MKNLDDFKEKYPDIYDAVYKRGEKAGIEIGKSIERGRAQAEVMAAEDQKFESLVAGLMKSENLSAAKAIEKVVRENPKAHEDYLARAKNSDTNPPVAEGPEKWKAEYEADPELKSEFNSSESYIAYKKAFDNGQVRLLNRRKIQKYPIPDARKW